jgi:transcriptional regulator with XRE-family HTH domain
MRVGDQVEAGEPEPIGKLLARMRRERGWSQSQLAAKLCDAAGTPTVSRHEVSRWEREERTPGPFWLHWLAVVLDAPADQLEEAVAASRDPTAAAARPSDQRRLFRPPSAADILDALDHADSRDLLVLAHTWLAGPSGTAIVLAAASPELPQLVSAAGPETLSALEARLARRRRQDDVVGGLDLAEHIDRDLRVAVALLPTIRGAGVCRRALLVVAGYAQLAGWTWADAGNTARARRAYRVALRTAAAAGDRPLAAHALGSLSHHCLAVGDPHEALLLAKTGYAGVRTGGSALIRALLLHRVALAAARVGDRREAVAALLAAEQVAGQAEPGREPEWLYWLDAEELSAMTGRCLAAIGRPLRAVRLLSPRQVGAGPRTTAVYRIWLARCYVELGEVEQACRVGVVALVDTLAAGSVVAASELRNLLPLLRQHSDMPAVRRYARLADYAANYLSGAQPQQHRASA